MKETAGAGRAEVRRAEGTRGASLLGAAQPTPALPLLYKRGGHAGGRKVTVKLVRNLRRDSKGSCTVLSAGLDKTRKRGQLSACSLFSENHHKPCSAETSCLLHCEISIPFLSGSFSSSLSPAYPTPTPQCNLCQCRQGGTG